MELELDEPLELLFEELFELLFDELFDEPLELLLELPFELLLELLLELPFELLFEEPLDELFDELLPATMVRSCKAVEPTVRLPCASVMSANPCNGTRPVLVLVPGPAAACTPPTAARPVNAAAIILNLAFISFSVMIEQTMNLPHAVVLPVKGDGPTSPQGRPPIAAVSTENAKTAVFIPAVLKGVVSCSMAYVKIAPLRQEAQCSCKLKKNLAGPRDLDRHGAAAPATQ